MKFGFIKNKYILLTIFSLLFIIPFLYISLYNFSGAADDMYFAVRAPNLSYIEKIINSYNHYIGRYFNAFFFSLPSEIFMSVWFAQLHPIVDLLLLLFSIRYLIINIGLKSKDQIWKLCIISLAVILAFLPNIKTLYWFAGSTVYFFPFSGLIFIISLLIKDYYKSLKYVEYFILYLLIFAVSGSNEIFMTYILYSTFILVMLKYILKKPQKIFTILAFIISAFSTYLVLTSPGTKRRFDGEGVGKIVDVVASVFPITSELMWTWLFKDGLILVPILIIVSGVFGIKKIKRIPFMFFIIYAITLLLGGVIVITYSLGTEESILPRVLNIFFMLFVFIIIGAAVYLSKFYQVKSENQFVLWIGLMFLFFAQSKNVSNVHEDLLKGISVKAQAESMWRFNYIDTVSTQDVIMPRLTQNSKVLMIPDWGAAKNWTNQHLATYFDKEKVAVNQNISVEYYEKLSTSLNKIHKNSGYKFWVNIKENKLKIENIGGNIQNNFFCLIYPQDKTKLQNSEVNFLNKGFNFPKNISTYTIELPNFKIDRILIGQLSNKERIWSETIYFNPPF